MWGLFAGGACAGLWLPATTPQPAGAVITTASGLSQPGDLFEVLDRLDADPVSVIGRRVSVSGEWMPASDRRPATISRRIMSCCAADTVAVGFNVDVARDVHIRAQSWVRVTGVVREQLRDGEPSYVLEQSSITALEDPAADRR
jgi:uncharacterized membrane protein YcgQ (UPF0703/DUF1980 family)